MDRELAAFARRRSPGCGAGKPRRPGRAGGQAERTAAMVNAMLEIRGLSKRFGGLLATDRVDLTVDRGEVHALIGPNGAGKTTLIGQLAGELKPDAGEIRLDGERIDALPVARRVALGLARTFQITSLLPEFSPLQSVKLAFQIKRGHSFRFWRQAGIDAGRRRRAQDVLAQTGLGAVA